MPARRTPWLRRLGLAAALHFSLTAAAAAQLRDCTVALVLALDVSASVDAREYHIQMEGLAEAFRDRAVVETILAYPGAGIMVSAFMWSGFQHQEEIAPWTWLGDEAAITAFAEQLSAMPRQHDYWPTALGRAVGHGAALHAQNPMVCHRRIIDVSGDGINNDGQAPRWYTAQGLLDGITVNGLVIQGAAPDPTEHYRRQVVHGPGAFLEIASDFDDYPRAILRKLLRELQPMLGEAGSSPVATR